MSVGPKFVSLAEYVRGHFGYSPNWSDSFCYKSGDPYSLSTPEVRPFPPFDPRRQTAPVVGVLGECAYCWEAIVPVPSVLTLVYTP
jgi:hypothetical protein